MPIHRALLTCALFLALSGCTSYQTLPSGTAPLIHGQPAIAQYRYQTVLYTTLAPSTIWRDPARPTQVFESLELAATASETLHQHDAYPRWSAPGEYASLVYIIALEPLTWIVIDGPFKDPLKDSTSLPFSQSRLVGAVCSGNLVPGSGDVSVWCPATGVFGQPGVLSPGRITLPGTPYSLHLVDSDVYRVVGVEEE